MSFQTSKDMGCHWISDVICFFHSSQSQECKVDFIIPTKKSSMSDLRPLRVICPGLELFEWCASDTFVLCVAYPKFFSVKDWPKAWKKGSIIVEGFEDVHIQMIVDVRCSKCSNVYKLYVCIICICDIFLYYMHVIRSGMTLFDIIFIYIFTYGYIWASVNKVLCCCLSIFRAPWLHQTRIL